MRYHAIHQSTLRLRLDSFRRPQRREGVVDIVIRDVFLKMAAPDTVYCPLCDGAKMGVDKPQSFSAARLLFLGLRCSKWVEFTGGAELLRWPSRRNGEERAVGSLTEWRAKPWIPQGLRRTLPPRSNAVWTKRRAIPPPQP